MSACVLALLHLIMWLCMSVHAAGLTAGATDAASDVIAVTCLKHSVTPNETSNSSSSDVAGDANTGGPQQLLALQFDVVNRARSQV